MKRAYLALLTVLLLTLFNLPAFAEEKNPEASKLNVNTASAEQLQKVPGITAEIAGSIVKYREEMGDIQNLDELVEVKGISKELLGKLKEFISVDAIAGSECTC